MTRTPFRFATWMLPLLLTVSLRSALAVADDPVAAIPVSPGDSQAGALIGDPCPSFSWGAVAGAQRYELAIFDAQWDDSPGYEDQQRQGVALRRIEIDAPALSWTPAGSECLDEGGSYLWFVRAATAAGGEEPWSAPRYFAIDYDADALTQTVRRELAAQLSQPGVWREVIQTALSGNRTLALTPLASAALMPAAPSDTATRAGGTRATSGWETSVISPQATTFLNPSALKINSPNGVVFNDPTVDPLLGPPGNGIPAEGKGTRFMWYSGKAALRAGYVTNTHWDDVNVGTYSTAMGANTIASGDASTALGCCTIARSGFETAIGMYNTDYDPDSTTHWSATDRLFVIGNGKGTYLSTPSDALVVLKNGNTTLNGQLAINGAMTQASSFNTPNLKLYQGSVNDFARLRLAVVDEPDFWDVAAGGSDNVFNIWLQGSGNLLTLHSSGTNLMSMNNGARLTSGGAWTNASDRALKNGFQPVDSGAILAQVVELPLSHWSYLREPGVRHIGPVAQDFHAAFGLGDSDTAIATVDADGVALAAIQGLHRTLETVAAAQAATANDLKQQTHEVRAQHQAAQAQQEAQQEQISAQQSLIAEIKTQNQSQQDLLQTQQAQIAAFQSEFKAQKEAHQQEIAALKTRNEAHAAQLVAERLEDMALLRAELHRLREQISAQPSVQRTAALP